MSVPNLFRNKVNKGIPKLFRSKVEHAKAFQAFHKRRGTKRGILKRFRSKEEQTEVFQSHSGAKRNKPTYSNTFQEQNGTNKPTCSKNLSRSMWNKPKKSKRVEAGQKELSTNFIQMTIQT